MAGFVWHRPRLNTRSVRFRTTVGAVIALALVLAVSGVIISTLVARQVNRSADATLLDQARDRAQLLAGGTETNSLINVVGDEVVVAVLDPSGAVIAAAGTTETERLASLPIGVSEASLILIDHHEDEDGDDEAPYAEPVRVAVAETGDGRRVVVGNENEQPARTIRATQIIFAVGGPLIAVAAALVAWLVTGRALAPVQRLRNDLQSVVAEAGVGRVGEPRTEDEIQALAETMNDVLDALERQSEARRQFVADASHELKSPIANARALLETGGDGDDEQRRVLDELNRLQSLVDDLLFLARTDETTAARPEAFDLDDVVFDEAERAAIRGGPAIDASGVQPARAVGDRQEISRAVRNLVENAVRHAESRVAVGIEAVDGSWTVSVTDDGPGIPADDRDRVFERFARLGDDRARGDGGTGLGLSIVATIAQRNGGTVAVADPPDTDTGARLELTVPAGREA